MKQSSSSIVALAGLLFAGSAGGCAALNKAFGYGPPPPKPEPVARPVKPVKYEFAEAEPLLVEAVGSFNKAHDKQLSRLVFGLDRWKMRRSEAGVLTGRRVPMRAYATDNAGACWAHGCDLMQDEVGGRWGDPYLQCNLNLGELVTCESVDALPPVGDASAAG